MPTYKADATIKACSTCQFWNGERKPGSFKMTVETKGMPSGICTNPKAVNIKGRSLRSDQPANNRCYQMWDQIKR